MRPLSCTRGTPLLCLLLVTFVFPEPVAGGARELVRLRRAGVLAGAQQQILPCSGYVGTTMDPCTPDFSGIKPSTEITEADIKEANMQAFINEVVKEEDERVATAAKESAVEAIALDEERRTAEADLQTAKEEAAALLTEAQTKAATDLSEATAAMIRCRCQICTSGAARAAREGPGAYQRLDGEAGQQLLRRLFACGGEGTPGSDESGRYRYSAV